MKFSVEWIRNLANVKLKAHQMAELLSEHTAEAEVESAKTFENIIVAEVVKVEKHPNADRLRVIELTDGRRTYAPVVCGAWNFDVGAKVPLALPGAIIPHDQHDPEGKPFTLGKATIRGVESQGMICSAKELGLGTDGGGIMILDESYKLGEDFQVGEEVLNVSSFANRPDLHSYLGVAREVAALTDSKLSSPEAATLPKPSNKFPVSIESKHAKHYSAVVLSNVEVRPSPEFVQERLKASGLRPINNVVDITNYVMLLTGQPMHAFDADKIDSGILVRHAEQNETLLTLDGENRKLSKDIMVIADKTKAVAIAGIIGGKETAVSDATNRIILEVANFDATSIRRASRNLNLKTDASSRFEKSLPIGFVTEGLKIAIALLQEHAGAKIDTYAQAGKQPERETVVSFSSEQVKDLLGFDVSSSEQKKILQKFGFKVGGTGSFMKATVPAWRPDVKIWQDIAEEIVRFKGLEAVPAVAPVSIFSSQHTDELVDFREKVADALSQMGLSEIYTYSFTDKEDKASLEISNPLNDEQRFLRTAILPNMLKVAAANSRFFDQSAYFEVGDIYRKGNGNFTESTKLGILLYSKNEYPTAQLNGIISNIAQKFDCRLELLQISEDSADVLMDGKAIGSVEILNHPDIKAVGASLDMRTMLSQARQRQFQPIPRYPSKALDTSIIVGDKTTWAAILKAAGKEPLLRNLALLDTYRGSAIPSGKKSLTIRAIYQASDHTLTDKEADAAHQQILQKIAQKTGASIRN